MTVDKYLYQKISFFLVNLMFIFGLTGVFLSSRGASVFIE